MIIWTFPCPDSAGGAKSSRKGGVKAVLAYRNFAQPPYDKQCFKLGYVVPVLSIWAVQHAEGLYLANSCKDRKTPCGVSQDITHLTVLDHDELRERWCFVKRYNHKQNDALGYFMWARFPSGSGTSAQLEWVTTIVWRAWIVWRPVLWVLLLELFAEVEDVHQTNPQSGPIFFLDLGISRVRRPR